RAGVGQRVQRVSYLMLFGSTIGGLLPTPLTRGFSRPTGEASRASAPKATVTAGRDRPARAAADAGGGPGRETRPTQRPPPVSSRLLARSRDSTGPCAALPGHPAFLPPWGTKRALAGNGARCARRSSRLSRRAHPVPRTPPTRRSR